MEILSVLLGIVYTQKTFYLSFFREGNCHEAFNALFFKNVVFQPAVFTKFFDIINLYVVSDLKLFHPERYGFKRYILQMVNLRGYPFGTDFVSIVGNIVFYIRFNNINPVGLIVVRFAGHIQWHHPNIPRKSATGGSRPDFFPP